MLTWVPEQRNRVLFRVTGHPEVMPGGPEVLFWEIALDVLQARFWIACA
jgi:hypothetical protein